MNLCPECRKSGLNVPDTAVQNLLKEEHHSKAENGGYYICTNPVCQVVYYNPATGQSFDKDAVRVKVWLKDNGDDVPLCYCNVITRSKIKEAWQKGARSYTEVVNVTGAATGKCNCKYENPSGRCCSGVIKEFLEDLENNGTNDSAQRTLEIEFLYLDLNVCTWCQSTDSNLEQAIAEVTQVLKATGVDVKLRKIHIQSEEQARELGFISSPTIRINGQDIQLEVKEALCDSCGDLCGDSVDCRIWTYQGKEYTAPPKGMIIDAILREVYGGTKKGTDSPAAAGEVPENLKKFFAAKQSKETGLSKEVCGCYSTSVSKNDTGSC